MSLKLTLANNLSSRHVDFFDACRHIGSMRLRDWLDSINATPEWLASHLGVSPRTVYAWIAGRPPRDREHIKAIVNLSKGKVTADDILLRPTPRKRPGRPKLAACRHSYVLIKR